MKRVLLALVGLLVLGGCATAQPEVNLATSHVYTEADIKQEVDVVKDEFAADFQGARLLKLSYKGDDAELFADWAADYQAEEAIILYTDFATDEQGGADKTLSPNTTYRDWQWILTRKQDSDWEFVTGGMN
ncbi:TPA: hypothetical protein TXJ06_001581 [Streptococcus suis]|nr:hypothetical protein [Streptococcus suis]